MYRTRFSGPFPAKLMLNRLFSHQIEYSQDIRPSKLRPHTLYFVPARVKYQQINVVGRAGYYVNVVDVVNVV